jgi:hypothetical protein
VNWRPRSLCLPVLAAAGLGCVTGLVISSPGPGRAPVAILRAAGTETPIKAVAPPVAPKPAAKPKAPLAPKAKAPAKRYLKPKPKPKGKSGYSLGLGPRGRTGPRGATGPAGSTGPQGPPGPVSNVVRSLTINWRNGAYQADPAASATLPGLGVVTLTCTPGAQTLTLVPQTAGVRTVLDTDTVQGAGTQGATSFARAASQSPGSPLTVPLPNNGMLLATVSVEPYNGDGGPGPDPATLTLSSEWKLNDPDASQNFCFVAAQFVGKP